MSFVMSCCHWSQHFIFQLLIKNKKIIYIIIDGYIQWHFKYLISYISWTSNNNLRRMECCPVMSDNDTAAMTKPRSLPAEQMSWVLLMLFVDASIDQGTECILSPSTNNAEIYWGNGKWNQITHRFVIRFGISSLFNKLTKRRSPAANVHDLSLFSYYLLTSAFMNELYLFCLLARMIQ